MNHLSPQLSLPYVIELLELGMVREALSLIQKLPPDVRESSPGRRAELQATTSLGLWQRALKLAWSLRLGSTNDRNAAAHAFQTLAAEAFKRGKEMEALKLANASLQARPEQIDDFVLDERFPERFRARFGLKFQPF